MKKLLLSFVAVFATMLCAGAAEASFDFSNPTSLNPSITPASTASSGVELKGTTFTNGSVSINVGDGSTTSKIWTNSDNSIELRVYNGAKVTFKASNGEAVTSIVFTGKTLGTATAPVFSFEVGSYDAAEKTWTGNASEVTMNISKTTKISTITVSTGAASGVSIDKPTFDPAAGTYYEAQSVSIKCATAGIDDIFYTTDGTNPLTSATKKAFSAPIAVDKTMTIKAVAVSGSDSSPIATAEYVISSLHTCNSVAEYLALEDNATGIINAPLTVFYQNGLNLFVTDGTTPLFIYGNIGKTYNNGDVIPAGIKGVKTPYYGNIEFVPEASSFADATPGTAIEPTVVELKDITVAHLNKYVKVVKATSSAAFTSSAKNFNIAQNGTTMVGYNTFKIDGAAIDTSKEYDFIGIISCRTANKTDNTPTADKLQFTPTAFTESTSSAVDGVVAESAKVVAGVGEINILGDYDNVAVFTVSGAQVSANDAKVNCPAGLYIVVVDGKAVKVAVK